VEENKSSELELCAITNSLAVIVPPNRPYVSGALLLHPSLDQIEFYLLNRLTGSARYEVYCRLKRCSHCKYTLHQLERRGEFDKQQLAPVIASSMQSNSAYCV